VALLTDNPLFAILSSHKNKSGKSPIDDPPQCPNVVILSEAKDLRRRPGPQHHPFIAPLYGRSTAAPQARAIANPTQICFFFLFPFDFQLSTVNLFLFRRYFITS
jgi:hypothetical protein